MAFVAIFATSMIVTGTRASPIVMAHSFQVNAVATSKTGRANGSVTTLSSLKQPRNHQRNEQLRVGQQAEAAAK